MKTYYELLEVGPDAQADEIKHAFRREIAKYHPDKVQHLGKEFQEIAALKASELTQAYKTLTDTDLRAEYDGRLTEAHPEPPRQPQPPVSKAPSPVPVSAPPVERIEDAAPPSSVLGGQYSQERTRVMEFILRAAAGRFRSALKGEFGHYDEVPATGFDATCVPKVSFWARKTPPPRVILRVVPVVDAAAVSEAWSLASKMSKDAQRDLCVFLMGPTVAPAEELATAIAAQRRKPMLAGRKLFMVPVSSSDWKAHVPTDAPDVVKSLLSRLKG